LHPPSPIDGVLARIPRLSGRVREVSELPGGLTNTNYKVTCDDGAYVVRVSSKDAGLLAIDRENEVHNSRAAAAAGVGAGVVDYLPDEGVLVLEYIEGRTIDAAELRRGDRLREAAEACRALHGAERFLLGFDMFTIQQGYLGIVRERGFRLPERYLEFAPKVEHMRAALAERDEGTVPCNNDLLAENFIWTGDRFRLIDYEYSGNNDAMFEIGNVWSESSLPLAHLDELVTHYYGERRVSRIARARLWGLMSKYGWTLWASIQDGVSPLEFDFWAWGMEKYVRAVEEFDGPDFERLLDEVRLSD